MAAQGSTLVVLAALIGNSLIAVTKFAASMITGSSAMMSEAIHSVVDTGNQALLLHGLRRAKKPPDEQHPFGYGREIYFWAFCVALLIFAIGAIVSIYEGIHKLSEPSRITSVHINYIVLSLAIVFEAGAWYIAFREFRKTKGRLSYFRAIRESKDPTVFTVLFEDTAAVLGLLVALVGVFLSDHYGLMFADGLASIIIGIILALTAMFLTYECKGLLIGEAAHPDTVKELKRILLAEDIVERVNEILTIHLGPQDILVNISLDFKSNYSSSDVEAVTARLEGAIMQQLVMVKRVFIKAQAFQPSFAAPLAP